ncbi:MAG: hypothetical protein HY645_03840 [Acidobacteria bacterium]|nr:hypothetical protein [Acidobacteriota bacterium]
MHSAATPSLNYSAPPEWIVETPSSPVRKAQYRLPKVSGDSEDAELAVFFFPGQGGSVEANLDRWIGQFTKPDGSPAKDASKITNKDINGISLTIVDVSGTYNASMGPMTDAKPKPGYRMIAAIAESANGPWFFKLTGPAGTVTKWESSFNDFLQTLKQG